MKSSIQLLLGAATIALAGCNGGSLTPQQQQRPPLISVPEFVFVTNDEDDNVSAYAINPATGALTPVAGSPFRTGEVPNGVATDPTGRFAFVVNSGFGSDNVSVYAINATTGALAPVAGSPFAAGSIPKAVAVDPTGKFAYVVNSGPSIELGNVSAYTINASTGALAAVAGSPFAAETFPDAVAVDPTGKFAYVANGGSVSDFLPGTVSAYTINTSTGALAPVAGSPFLVGTSANAVATDPTGKFAYVTDAFDNDVFAYTINAATGALTPVAGSPFAAGSGATGLAVDRTGRFVYVANNGGNVSAYTINASTGALAPVAGSPFAAGATPNAVAIDPTGKFAYVANFGAANISAYAINASTGALAPVAGTPFAAGHHPAGVAVAP